MKIKTKILIKNQIFKRKRENKTPKEPTDSKIIVEGRPDGGPTTRSKSLKNVSYAQIASSKLDMKFDFNSADTIEAVKLKKKCRLNFNISSQVTGLDVAI